MTAQPHRIVFANEKGGTGKSTTAVHVAVALAYRGARVAAFDLDHRQRTMCRYFENRAETMKRRRIDLPTVECHVVEGLDAEGMEALIARESQQADFILVDTPGRDDPLARHSATTSDTLVTPMNDSFVDFDLLARMSPEGKVLGPSIYAEMVWAARQMRGQAGAGPIDWLVLRNRLGTQAMHNKRRVGGALDTLSRRIGFRVAPGFSERVVFRELFPRGLTLLDLKDIGTETLNMSNIAARQELRDLIGELRLPGVSVTF